MKQHDFWKNAIQAGSQAFAHEEYRHAHQHFCAAARDAKTRDHKLHLSVSLHNLAVIYAKCGRKINALSCLEIALDAVRAASPGGSRLESCVLDKLADMLLTCDDPSHETTKEERRTAADFLESAHQIDCRVGGAYQVHMAQRLRRLAYLYYELADYERASLLYKEACDTDVLRHDREMILSQRQRTSTARGRARRKHLRALPARSLDFSPALEIVPIATI
jgi:tetratricopeptide (TPR) repeat protein